MSEVRVFTGVSPAGQRAVRAPSLGRLRMDGMSAPSPYAFLVNGDVFFDPHPGKQREVLELLRRRVLTREPAPANVFLWGNRGSGKSRLVRSFLHACAMACPGFTYVVVRRNMPDLRLNHMKFLGAEMRRLGGEWNETLGIAKYEVTGGKQSMGIYRQCEDEADAEKIVGAEAAVLFVDEATQIKWELLRLLGPSLRVPTDAAGQPGPYRTLVIYGGNPIGESTEDLWNYFVDQVVDPELDPEYHPADFLAVEIQRKDNPSIDELEYRKQFAGLAPHYRKAWLDGVRMDARTLFEVHKTITEDVRLTLGGQPRDTPLPEAWLGRPYHYLAELPTLSGVPLLQVPWVAVHRAYDHGFFPDPAVCLWLAVAGRRIYAVYEGTWFKTPPTEIAARLTEETRELIGDRPVAMTYADPDIDLKGRADHTVRDILEIEGIPIECSVNDRVLYADMIHALLGDEVEPGVPRFQVYEAGCPMLAKYLPKMRWDEKNPRRMADHKFDHWVVCLAYFAISSGVLGVTGPEDRVTRPVWMDWLEEDQHRGARRRRA